MQGAIYKTYTYTMAAGERIEVRRRLSFVACLEATAAFEIAMDNGDFGTFEKGLKYQTPEGKVLTGFALVNTSGAANTITLAIGYGDVTDARLNLSGSIEAKPATPQKWLNSAAVNVAAGAVAFLIGSNVSRREAIIANDGAETVYVRPGNTAAPGGVKLAPGATAVIETTAAIYAYNPSAVVVSVLPSWTEWA